RGRHRRGRHLRARRRRKGPVDEPDARPVTPSASNASDPTDNLSDEARDIEGASDRSGPTSPLAEAIEGFVNLGAWALREFGTHAQSVGRRIESDGYSADHVTRDVARSAALVTAAGLRTLNEFVDAAVV